MRCPFCACENTQVKDSRPTEENAAIRRRRICPDCGGRFTTFERVQLRELIIVKRSGRKVPFDRDKLVNSVSVALRKRPVDGERIERMISGIVRQLESSGETEIPSATIGELVMDALRAVDPVAYVRFASVYRDFRNAADFADVLGEIARDAVPPADAAAMAETWSEGSELPPSAEAADVGPDPQHDAKPRSAMSSVAAPAVSGGLSVKNH